MFFRRPKESNRRDAENRQIIKLGWPSSSLDWLRLKWSQSIDEDQSGPTITAAIIIIIIIIIAAATAVVSSAYRRMD